MLSFHLLFHLSTTSFRTFTFSITTSEVVIGAKQKDNREPGVYRGNAELGGEQSIMLTDELSSDMDRITQLQDAILDLLTITATSIDYITKRTQFEQTSREVTQALQTVEGAPKDEYRESIEGFVQDIVKRSKDCERLIAALPQKSDSAARVKRLEELKVEMDDANTEYKEVLAQAEDLLKELQNALGTALGEESRTNLSKAIDSISPA